MIKEFVAQFQEIFNKETLNQKYNQLAELRNCIRHSRSAGCYYQKGRRLQSCGLKGIEDRINEK